MPDGMQAAPLSPRHGCVTPEFDRIGSTGIRFSRAYTPTPTCSPARASLMTGLLAHNHGVLQIEHCVDEDQSVLRPDNAHWAQRLSEAGYRTGYFGKWHIERSVQLDRFGWSVNGAQGSDLYVQATSGKVDPEDGHLDPQLTGYRSERPGYRRLLHYGVTDIPVEKRSVSIPADLATPFITAAAQSQEPWCCCVSYPMPNEALICSRGSFSHYDPASLVLPDNFYDTFESGPALYRRAQEVWADLSDSQWRMAMACYYARITEMDSQFGRLLRLLESTEQLDNTIVIVTSDHGRYVGSHGFDAHNFGAFEEIYNIPMFFSGPGIPKDVVTDARGGLHDLCPTLLDLTDTPSIETADSTSFSTIVRNGFRSDDQFATGYAEYHGTRYPTMQRIAWDGPWKFVFNGFDYDELYNLDQDPSEMINLAARPEHAVTVDRMTRLIWNKIRETGDRTLLEAHYYSMRFATVGPGA